MSRTAWFGHEAAGECNRTYCNTASPNPLASIVKLPELEAGDQTERAVQPAGKRFMAKIAFDKPKSAHAEVGSRRSRLTPKSAHAEVGSRRSRLTPKSAHAEET